MRNLIDGLPRDARLRSETPDEPWGVIEELTAMLIEEVSIFTSDRRRKQPLEIPRPGRAVEVVDDEVAAEKHGAIPARKHGGMLAAAIAAGRAKASVPSG